MTLTDRETFIVLFLHAIHSDDNNKAAMIKLEKYSKILGLQINDNESIELMQELDVIMLDIIDLEASHMKHLKRIRDGLKN